uniref:Uncharacterized protein n=1 Tax=Streptomyces sp. NBC_00093 TaxID=2975649 RepID=A0AAU2AEQ3_9ACTN
MTEQSPFPVRLANDVARQLGALTEYLLDAPPHEAARILATVLSNSGVLDRLTGLLVTGSRFAQHHSEQGVLPPEVWLAIGRAANELHDIHLDLDEHTEALDALAGTGAPAPTTAPTPVPTAMVVRRRR